MKTFCTLERRCIGTCKCPLLLILMLLYSSAQSLAIFSILLFLDTDLWQFFLPNGFGPEIWQFLILYSAVILTLTLRKKSIGGGHMWARASCFLGSVVRMRREYSLSCIWGWHTEYYITLLILTGNRQNISIFRPQSARALFRIAVVQPCIETHMYRTGLLTCECDFMFHFFQLKHNAITDTGALSTKGYQTSSYRILTKIW